MKQDEKYISRCIQLGLQSLESGDLPFGALITCDGEVIAESCNTGKKDITGHAEINVMRKVIEGMPDINIAECTLYTNFEPCAMCSFMIRDYGIKRVVFSVFSPYLGGHSKWNILHEPIRPEFTSNGSDRVPEVRGGVLEKECSEIFDGLNWKMHLSVKRHLHRWR